MLDAVRRKRLAPFKRAGFRVRAAAVVLPDSVLFMRQAKQHNEQGKFIADEAIADMKARFALPQVGRLAGLAGCVPATAVLVSRLAPVSGAATCWRHAMMPAAL